MWYYLIKQYSVLERGNDMKKNILFDSDLDIPIDKSAPETFDESTFE
jgi:hypothetical protein